MAILNYTTSISYEKTIGEIQQCLVKHGAMKFVTDYASKNGVMIPSSVTFAIFIQERMIFFSLPAKYDGVLKAMKSDKKVPKKLLTEEQALRVSWRIIKDWVVAQMAIVQAGCAEMSEVFLPYAVTKTGRTVYQDMMEGKSAQLAIGN